MIKIYYYFPFKIDRKTVRIKSGIINNQPAMQRLLETVCFLTMILFSFTAISNEKSSNETKLIELSDALFIYSTNNTPPDFSSSHQVTLPHNWNGSGLYGSGWYKINFDLDEIGSQETWSVFLPQVIMNSQVWLNGEMVGTGGSLVKPISRYWHTPMMFSFPSVLLKKSNTLYIRVIGYTNQHAKLGKVLVGSEQNISPLYQSKYFTSVTLNILSGTLSFLIGILLFTIWLWRRKSTYFWFSISSFMWTLYSINIFTQNLLIPEEYWEKIIFLSSGWLAISIAFLMVRLAKEHHPKSEKVILLLSTIINLIIWFSSEEIMFSLFPIWLQFSFIVACIGITRVAWHWYKTKELSSAIILLLVLGIAIAGCHDVLVQSGWLDIGDGLWLDYTLPLFFLIMSYLLVSKFIAALEEKEVLNLELENRIADAGALIEKNYHKILIMEKDLATKTERERIHRDLHDSIGAKLLSLVYRSETSEHSNLARSALTDLRGIVQQPPIGKENLTDKIGEWESDCNQRCFNSNKRLIFYSYNINSDLELTSKTSQNVYAVLTEAITNSIKHGKSNQIEVSIRHRLNCIKISVKEKADYSNYQNWSRGCGIDNMKFRIKELDGKINWRNKGNNGVISWIFPLLMT